MPVTGPPASCVNPDLVDTYVPDVEKPWEDETRMQDESDFEAGLIGTRGGLPTAFRNDLNARRICNYVCINFLGYRSSGELCNC